jgi:hypothetical protein
MMQMNNEFFSNKTANFANDETGILNVRAFAPNNHNFTMQTEFNQNTNLIDAAHK